MSEEVEAIKNIEDQGITQVAADDIHDWIIGIEALKKKVKVPGFNEFHPKFAKPLHDLICELLKDSEAHLEKFPEGYFSKRKYYSDYQVRNDEAWRETTELATIGFVDTNDTKTLNDGEQIQRTRKKKKPAPRFRPKFRIVLGGPSNTGAIYSES